MTDNAGFSEETCVRCGWRMGSPALNCQNDNTPHVFPSQQARVTQLEADVAVHEAAAIAASAERDASDEAAATWATLLAETQARVTQLEAALRPTPAPPSSS